MASPAARLPACQAQRDHLRRAPPRLARVWYHEKWTMLSVMIQPALTTQTDTLCLASQLYYSAAGDGQEAVVLLHGWGDTREVWRPTLRALAPYARAFALDLPGHGGSPLARATQMRQVANRVATFCATRGLASIALVGHSMGGNVALELALNQPELVARLVLVAPAALASAMPPYTRLYLQNGYGWAALRASLLVYRGLDALSRGWRPLADAGRRAPGLRRAAVAAHHDPDELRCLLGGLFANPLDDRLGQVRAPTLVISGDLDAVVPVGLSRRVAAAIPGARFALVRRALHHPMDEQPEAFLQALLGFLT